MKSNHEFVLADGQTAASSSGVSVEFTGPFALVYKEKDRSIKFRIDNTFALDLVLTYLVYMPERPAWRESNQALNERELKTLRKIVVEALKLFNGIPLFIGPKTPNAPRKTSPEGCSYVH